MAYQSSGSSSSSGPSGFQFLNSPFGDTTYTKVFVGGLAWETHSDTMRRYFEQFGEILEAVVISDKNTGRSKGYGFVTFREPEAAARACADPTPVIDGRRANCNLASLRRPRPPMHYGRPRPAAPYIGSMQATRGAYIGGYGYQQPVPYNYQQGLMYPNYGFGTYGPEYTYSQVSNVLKWQHNCDCIFFGFMNEDIMLLYVLTCSQNFVISLVGCLQPLCGSAISSDVWSSRDG
ncbi:unnamed protein product [Prunus armeniaca]